MAAAALTAGIWFSGPRNEGVLSVTTECVTGNGPLPRLSVGQPACFSPLEQQQASSAVAWLPIALLVRNSSLNHNSGQVCP